MRRHFAVVFAAAVTLAAPAAVAQNPPTGGGPGGQGFAERRMQMLLKDITLTPQQQAKIDSIRTRYRAQMPAFTPGTPPDSTTRQRMRDVIRRQNDEIRLVLTPEQQKLWDRNIAEMQARRPGGS